MLFTKIEGHGNILPTLEKMCTNRKFRGAYLFSGPVSVGKYTIASVLTKHILCTGKELDTDCRCSSCRQFPESPDLFAIDKGSRSKILVEDVAGIEEFISLSPYKSPQRVVLINDAHNMNPQAANRLLKLLEISRDVVVFLLV